MERQPWCLIEPIHLIVIGRIWLQAVITLFHDHVASGAGAASSAGVFDMYTEIDGHI
jgi:hypothetical protein